MLKFQKDFTNLNKVKFGFKLEKPMQANFDDADGVYSFYS